MSQILPAFPRLVLTVFEPLSLVAGFLGPLIMTPELFISEQTLFSQVEEISVGSKMVAYQLGNIYLLLAMVGVAVLYATTEPLVVRNYVIALLLADISHVGITAWVMGYNQVIDILNWNPMAIGNIAVTVFLFLTRSAYLLGLFGPNRIPRKEKVV